MSVNQVPAEFMNNIYNAIGGQVSGTYNDMPFLGTIDSTRVMYGNDIEVVVEDMVTDEIYLINSTTLYEGENGVYKNLHKPALWHINWQRGST